MRISMALLQVTSSYNNPIIFKNFNSNIYCWIAQLLLALRSIIETTRENEHIPTAVAVIMKIIL